MARGLHTLPYQKGSAIAIDFNLLWSGRICRSFRSCRLVRRMASPVPKITIAPDDSPQPSEFLFRNRRFMSIDRAPSNSSSCYNSDESDYSVDWDSFSEDEQVEMNYVYTCP